MGVSLLPVDPDDGAAVSLAAAILRRCEAVDQPWAPETSPFRLAQEIRHGWDGEPRPHFVAVDAAGDPVGVAVVETGEWDNRDLAWLEVRIRPDVRRRGHGDAVLAALEEPTRAKGRTVQGIDTWVGPTDPADHPWATRHGFTVRAVEACRRLDLDAGGSTLARVEGLEPAAAPHATAYVLEAYAGASPAAVLPGLVAVTEAINDAPSDDLEIEPEVHPVERVRGYESAQLASRRLHRVLARHRGTGEVVGHTVVAVDVDRPDTAWQHDTAVLPAHRGHRLGLLLKIAMVRWLAEREPDVRRVFTENAESNGPMVAVNEAMGHVLVARNVELQRRLT